MRVWRHTPWDAVMLVLSVAQVSLTVWLATQWDAAGVPARLAFIALLTASITYHVIVVCHVFTHTPWFRSPLLNAAASMLNSANIAQSVQAYELSHVRNHHEYGNDRPGPDGKTLDLSSTFLEGTSGEHAGLFRYAFLGAVRTLRRMTRELLPVPRLWRVGEHEREIVDLASRNPARRQRELGQIRLDRIACFVAIAVLTLISWRFVVTGFVPALYLALALVNVQNYYEHYGAAPGDRFADAVSHYGRVYNRLTFNDGYHQEHHLCPQAHWTRLPEVRRKYADHLGEADRVVCPVPALLGVLHRQRPQLHRNPPARPSAPRRAKERVRHGRAVASASSPALSIHEPDPSRDQFVSADR